MGVDDVFPIVTLRCDRESRPDGRWADRRGPVDQPWGERVARAEDPDGDQLIFGQRALSE
jgi:hypothetical protein